MSESLEHHNYVKVIYNYVQKMIDQSEACFLKADIFSCDKPTLVYGSFVPDVMYCYNNKLIIGEAKTLDDYNREHSYKQYESYIKECGNFPGESYLIICIPWPLFLNAKNHFKLLKNKYSPNTSIIVLTDNGMEARV